MQLATAACCLTRQLLLGALFCCRAAAKLGSADYAGAVEDAQAARALDHK